MGASFRDLRTWTHHHGFPKLLPSILTAKGKTYYHESSDFKIEILKREKKSEMLTGAIKQTRAHH